MTSVALIGTGLLGEAIAKRLLREGLALNVWNRTSCRMDTLIKEGYLALIASALAFSLMTVCVKHLEGRIPISEIIFIRSIIVHLLILFYVQDPF